MQASSSKTQPNIRYRLFTPLFFVYQKLISPFLHSLLAPVVGSSHSCRFTPTCSEYARQAIRHYGIIRGSYLATLRVLRCNPLFKGGADPLII